jgi:hypothetical protein
MIGTAFPKKVFFTMVKKTSSAGNLAVISAVTFCVQHFNITKCNILFQKCFKKVAVLGSASSAGLTVLG